jgi:hypothetical protein
MAVRAWHHQGVVPESLVVIFTPVLPLYPIHNRNNGLAVDAKGAGGDAVGEQQRWHRGGLRCD